MAQSSAEEPIKRVIIVGGGLGGLALAHLLRSSPTITVSVYERDTVPDARGQGYYIGLNGGGLTLVREKLLKCAPSLVSVLADQNLCLNGFAMVTSRFRTMMRLISMGSLFETRLVSRWGLRASLATALPAEMIHWNKQVLRYEEKPNEVCVHFHDGTQVTGDLLIGADGVRSAIRAQRIPTLEVKEVGVVNFGGFLPESEELRKLLAPWATLGIRCLGAAGHSLLVLRYSTPEKQPMVLWSLSWPAQVDDATMMSEWRAVKLKVGKEDDTNKYSAEETAYLLKLQQLVARKAELHFKEKGVKSMVVGTAPPHLFAPQTVKSMHEPPAPATYAAPSRVFLIGDAAHAMTTHRGQGANTAFEDAEDVADLLLRNGGTRVPDLRALQAKVFKRGFERVAGSMSSTRSIHATGWRAVVRDVMVYIIGTLIIPPMLFFMGLKYRLTGSDKKAA